VCVNTYIYVHVNTYIYVCVCVCVRARVYIHIYIYIERERERESKTMHIFVSWPLKHYLIKAHLEKVIEYRMCVLVFTTIFDRIIYCKKN